MTTSVPKTVKFCQYDVFEKPCAVCHELTRRTVYDTHKHDSAFAAQRANDDFHLCLKCEEKMQHR